MNTNNEEPLHRAPEDLVMADYATSLSFRTNPNAKGSLHTFFSPNRVPVGLTDREVAICIHLSLYRERMNAIYNAEEDAKLARLNFVPIPPPTIHDALVLVGAGVHDTIDAATQHLDHFYGMFEHLRCHPVRILPLPQELGPDRVMTRDRFRKGIRLFIQEYRRRCDPKN